MYLFCFYMMLILFFFWPSAQLSTWISASESWFSCDRCLTGLHREVLVAGCVCLSADGHLFLGLELSVLPVLWLSVGWEKRCGGCSLFLKAALGRDTFGTARLSCVLASDLNVRGTGDIIYISSLKKYIYAFHNRDDELRTNGL